LFTVAFPLVQVAPPAFGKRFHKEEPMKRLIPIAIVAMLAVMVAAPASATPNGNHGRSPIVSGAIWADGDLLATRPLGSLPYNDNPQAFDHLYVIEGQAAVSEAGPGNPAYNGGRWIPTEVEKTGAFPEALVITSYDELMAAADAGWVVIGDGDTESTFLCPLIKNH